MSEFLDSVVFAEGQANQPQSGGTTADGGNGQTSDQNMQEGNPIWSMLFPLVLFILFFYFILVRPQKKQEKKQKEMLAALQVGDKIVTIGGICGKITKLKDEYVYIETGSVGNPNEKSIIKFERSAVKTVETIHE